MLGPGSHPDQPEILVENYGSERAIEKAGALLQVAGTDWNRTPPSNAARVRRQGRDCLARGPVIPGTPISLPDSTHFFDT